MNNYVETLQTSIYNLEEFSKLFKQVFVSEDGNWFKEKFSNKRLPYLFECILPSEDKITLKFNNVIKRIRNSKNVEIPGRESWLSYIEVIVSPLGKKAYSYTTDISQFTWSKAGKQKATELHNKKLETLKAMANNVGINLENPKCWSTIYTENY